MPSFTLYIKDSIYERLVRASNKAKAKPQDKVNEILDKNLER